MSAATAASAKVRSRLPNSMKPWMPISGVFTIESEVQRGQVGQPRPEAVRRTAPPVTTKSVWPIREATARRRMRASTVRGSRDARRPAIWGRREAVVTIISIPLEPTDGCGSGNDGPEQQDKGGAAVYGPAQESGAHRFPEGAGRQEMDHGLRRGGQPFGRDDDAAHGSQEDPQQVGNRQRRFRPDGTC